MSLFLVNQTRLLTGLCRLSGGNLTNMSIISDYCRYLENSFLCFYVNRYNDSLKKQMYYPKKMYFIDHALARIVGFRPSADEGRLLENIIYIELRRRFAEIYYHQEKRECDFLVRDAGKIIAAIQVCQNLNNSVTKQREYAGLLEALERHQLSQGLILTAYENYDEIVLHQQKKYQIQVRPIWKWLLGLE